MPRSKEKDGKSLRILHDNVTTLYNKLVEVEPEMAKMDAALLPICDRIYKYELRRDAYAKLGSPPAGGVKAYLSCIEDLITTELRLRDTHFRPPVQEEKKQDRQQQQQQQQYKGPATAVGMAAVKGPPRKGGRKGQSGPTHSERNFTTASGNRGNGSPKGGPNCDLCGPGHWIISCSVFSKMNLKDKRKIVMEKSLCFSCLRSTPSHQSKECSYAKACTQKEGGQVCGSRHHHQLLHPPAKSGGRKRRD